MERSKVEPVSECSMSMPQIFLSSTYMSLGHFIRALSGAMSSFIKSTRASDTTIESSNWRFASSEVLNNIENVRFAPGSASQELPLCPRPAVCSRAAMSRPSGAEGSSLSRVLVEAQLSTTRVRFVSDIVSEGSGIVVVYGNANRDGISRQSCCDTFGPLDEAYRTGIEIILDTEVERFFQ